MKIITTSAAQTKKLGKGFAEELRGGEIICLSGDLGAGKTTFTQGLLAGLKIKGPYTSPTFTIVKEYSLSYLKFQKNNSAFEIEKSEFKNINIHHIDAYRIVSKDLLELGWNDFAGKKNSITILEWPEKVEKIIPKNTLRIEFKWINNKEREISFSIKKER